VDLRKVNLSVLRGWIAKKVTELIRVEDDVVVEYVYGMLEDRDTPVSWSVWCNALADRL
jgi:serine/arginine repetitive matrix protein 1